MKGATIKKIGNRKAATYQVVAWVHRSSRSDQGGVSKL